MKERTGEDILNYQVPSLKPSKGSGFSFVLYKGIFSFVLYKEGEGIVDLPYRSEVQFEKLFNILCQ